MTPGETFLVVHHRSTYCGFNDDVLDWIAVNLPDERPRFRLKALPYDLRDTDHDRVLIPWLQDPVEAWSPRTYVQAMALTQACERRGIPVVNRVDRLARAGKFEGAALMRAAGLRVPRVARITDVAAFRENRLGIPLPLFIREDVGHQGEMIRADTPAEVRALPIERFKSPVAIELIDLFDPRDRLYRKYRYVVSGERGVPHHMQASATWITRGGGRIVDERTRNEELRYIGASSPYHAAFLRASQALGLDFVAFDYSIDADGQPVVWEANPYPFLQFSRTYLAYRNEAMHRTMAILVALYYERAELPLPDALQAYLSVERAIRDPARQPPADGARAVSWRVPGPRTALGRTRLVLAKTWRRLRQETRRL
jgi:hypothetical protein